MGWPSCSGRGRCCPGRAPPRRHGGGVRRARIGQVPGAYLLQASIAAHHARTLDGNPPDWAAIAALYGLLAEVAPSPVVELNRAVAVAAAEGPGPGLEIVERVAATGALSNYHLLHATRADLLRRLGRDAEAITAYRRAADLATNGPEREFLLRRIAQMERAEGS